MAYPTTFAYVLCCFQAVEDEAVKWSQKERVAYKAQTPYRKNEGN